MADLEYLGTITNAANGQFVRRAEAIPLRPAEPEPKVVFPLQYSSREGIMPWLVVGDSMAPTILDHDLMFSDVGLIPWPHDIVMVPFEGHRA